MKIEKILMAFLVSLVFAACFEDNNLAADDPSIESSNDLNLSSSSDLNVSSSSEENAPASSSSIQIEEPMTTYTGIKIYSPERNTFFAASELDSVTFDPIRVAAGVSDRLYNPGASFFVIGNLSVKSPYAKIVVGYSGHQYNIVDLRQSDAFAVNTKTYLESIRLVYLTNSGMKFADAKKQASKEVLQAFGTYNDSYDKGDIENIENQDYTKYIAFIADFVEHSSVDTIATYFEKCGNITCDKESLKKRYLTEAMDLVKQTPLFLGNFYAKMLDAGTCTAEKEGDSLEALPSSWLNFDVTVRCRSGEWKFLYKEMEHTMGTMTDERDGKTYKTVTYDLNGKTQTWMAENLTYAIDSLHIPCEENTEYCDLYFVEGALNIDSSLVYPSTDSCIKLWFNKYDRRARGDTMTAMSDCSEREGRYFQLKSVPYVESVMAEKGIYQGLCPDGWHIPTMNEVITLSDYLMEWYQPSIPQKYEDLEEDEKIGWIREVLYDSPLGDPTGFGSKRRSYGFFVIDGYLPLPALGRTPPFEYISGSVRCIKD